VYVHCLSAYVTCFSSGVITPAAFSGVVLAMAVAMLGVRDGGLEGGEVAAAQVAVGIRVRK